MADLWRFRKFKFCQFVKFELKNFDVCVPLFVALMQIVFVVVSVICKQCCIQLPMELMTINREKT